MIISTEATDQEITKIKKQIRLSFDSILTTDRFIRKDIMINYIIQVSVISIEDHRMIIDISLSDIEIQNFIFTIELLYKIDISQMKTDMILLCFMISPAINEYIVKLSAILNNLKKKNNFCIIDTAFNVNSFLSDTLIEILFFDITNTDLADKIMNLLDVIYDIVYSETRSSSSFLEKIHKSEEKLMDRILNTFLLSDTKKLGFSIFKYMINIDIKASSLDYNRKDKYILYIFFIMNQTKVVKVESGLEIYFRLDSNSLNGFAYILQLNDIKIDIFPVYSDLYKISTVYRTRMLNYNIMNDLYVLSL